MGSRCFIALALSVGEGESCLRHAYGSQNASRTPYLTGAVPDTANPRPAVAAVGSLCW